MNTPLYDVAKALGELTQYRATATVDPLAAQSITIADKLACHMARHFPDATDRSTAGAALVILAASITSLSGIPVEVVANITGLAGQELTQGATR